MNYQIRPEQAAFHSEYSPIQQLVKLIDIISLNNGFQTVFVILDVKKTFNMVCHNSLLKIYPK